MKRMPFSTWSVLGILAGRKTQTRRMMKGVLDLPGIWVWHNTEPHVGPKAWLWTMDHGDGNPWYEVKPRYKVGEVVAMGEALVAHPLRCSMEAIVYEADGEPLANLFVSDAWQWKVKKLNAMYMPTWAARRWLRITDVRAERMLDISEEDALAEGLQIGRSPRTSDDPDKWRASDGTWYPDHVSAWIDTMRAHNPKMQPDDNPWLFAYTLEQVDKPKGERHEAS